jgi:hypothetical protein
MNNRRVFDLFDYLDEIDIVYSTSTNLGYVSGDQVGTFHEKAEVENVQQMQHLN